MFDLEDVTYIGSNLSRPECVLATRAGHLYVSDFRGGVTQIAADGSCSFFGGKPHGNIGILQPNGICMLPDGSFLAAHLGETLGGVFRVTRQNDICDYLTHIDNQIIPPSNFITLDHQGRLWLTVSTRHQPRALAYRSDIADGFIAVIDQQGARIVADNIGYTNEVFITPDGKKLFANATFARQVLAYDISANNTLTNKRIICELGDGSFPDGITMDAVGDLWLSSIVSNRIIRLRPDTGETEIMLEDVDEEYLAQVESAYTRHKMNKTHLANINSAQLKNISSLAFGGDDLNTLYCGCLLGTKIAKFPVKIAGLAPSHWLFDDA